MADTFRIIVNPDAGLRTNLSSDSLVGVIYFERGEDAFPERGWTDFAYPILGWWVGECERLMNGIAPECELAFMDGPVSAHLQKVSDVAVEIRCVDRRAPRDALEFVVTFELLVNELERVCLLLDEACRRRDLKVDAFAPRAKRLRVMFDRNGRKMKPVRD